ncbi:EcoKI restriction-modification system protein HsdS [Myroides odoratus]|nr:EcoKI restriction-modification system protein HsdS [Myroides odoratus]
MTSKRLKDKKVPNLRFPGFEEEWKTKKLGDLLEFKNGINATKEQYGNGYKFINVLDILSNEFITYDKIIGSVNVTNEIINKFPVNYGDILFQRSSETREEVGTTSVYLDKHKTATFGGFVIRGKQIGEYEPIFLNKALKTSFVRNQITSKSGGSTRYNVGQEILASVTLSLPSIIEQQKIASFLSLIDERITTQNKIIEYQETLMLGVLTKIFTQKLKSNSIRTKEFPLWTYKKGGDIFYNCSNKKHNSDLPILAITQEYGAVPRDLIDHNITVTEKSIDSYKVVDKGDFIISLRSFQGGIEYSNYHGICSPAYIILKNSIDIVPEFYKHYLKSAAYIKLLNKKLEGIRDGKMISYNYFSEINLPYPCLEEQKYIADILTTIDNKIKIEKQMLNSLSKQRDYLLQQMFI